jgi:hypothetical protein
LLVDFEVSNGADVNSHTPLPIMVAPHNTAHPKVLSSPIISATDNSGKNVFTGTVIRIDPIICAPISYNPAM